MNITNLHRKRARRIISHLKQPIEDHSVKHRLHSVLEYNVDTTMIGECDNFEIVVMILKWTANDHETNESYVIKQTISLPSAINFDCGLVATQAFEAMVKKFDELAAMDDFGSVDATLDVFDVT